MPKFSVLRSIRRHWRVSLAMLVLAGALLGLFLATRSYVRPPDRWRASVQLLVPARDDKGRRPEGVPPGLLQGQAQVALSRPVITATLDAVKVSPENRNEIRFDFSTNDPGDVLILSATSLDFDLSRRLADRFATEYRTARLERVSNDKERQATVLTQVITSYNRRLNEVKDALADRDPRLLFLLDPTPNASNGQTPAPTFTLPADAPFDTVLLVYEGRDLTTRIRGALGAYAKTKVDAIAPSTFSSVVERDPPRQITPRLPSWVPPAGVAAALGLLLALAVPVLIDRFDKTIWDPRTASRAMSSVVLARIPAVSHSKLTTLARPGSDRDIAYRALATTSIATDRMPRSIVVASPVGTMQDTVAANFAAALAGLGLKVALVATDERQSWYADTGDDVPTLPDYLALARGGQLDGQVRESLVATPGENLRVIPYGPTTAETLLEDLPALLAAFADADIDVTVITGPATLEDPSATIYAWSTRSVLWVIDAGQVEEDDATDAAARLALAGASPFGIVMIDGLDY